MLNDAIAASKLHTIPHVSAIERAEFPKAWKERPLVAWLQQQVRQFWALCVTGTSAPGDCFNRLAHVAHMALDARFSAETAQRAAVRYDSYQYQSVCFQALKARGGDEVRALLRQYCNEFKESRANRFPEEEAQDLKEEGISAPPPCGAGYSERANANTALKNALSNGGEISLLWALGSCSKTEASCGKVHQCPVCGSLTKGCLSKTHGNCVRRTLELKCRSPRGRVASAPALRRGRRIRTRTRAEGAEATTARETVTKSKRRSPDRVRSARDSAWPLRGWLPAGKPGPQLIVAARRSWRHHA